MMDASLSVRDVIVTLTAIARSAASVKVPSSRTMVSPFCAAATAAAKVAWSDGTLIVAAKRGATAKMIQEFTMNFKLDFINAVP